MPYRPDGFLLSTKCGFYPQRSGGLFIEFCQHEVPSLMSCRMEANLFADSRHGSDDAGRSPQTKRFLFSFFCITIVVKFKINDYNEATYFSNITCRVSGHR